MHVDNVLGRFILLAFQNRIRACPGCWLDCLLVYGPSYSSKVGPITFCSPCACLDFDHDFFNVLASFMYGGITEGSRANFHNVCMSMIM